MQVLEGRSVDEIARLNTCYTQSAVMFEYDGAVMQDLSMQLFWALGRILMYSGLLSWRVKRGLELAAAARWQTSESNPGLCPNCPVSADYKELCQSGTITSYLIGLF